MPPRRFSVLDRPMPARSGEREKTAYLIRGGARVLVSHGDQLAGESALEQQVAQQQRAGGVVGAERAHQGTQGARQLMRMPARDFIHVPRWNQHQRVDVAEFGILVVAVDALEV